VLRCFDRETRAPVQPTALQSYAEALAQYHLHPEAKFGNGDYLDSGMTTRRHILATDIEHIGKEANRWEEQLYLGEMPETQIIYGVSPQVYELSIEETLDACRAFGVRTLARSSGISTGAVSMILSRRRRPSAEALRRLQYAVRELNQASPERPTTT
jgi:hypothetical protein